ncbi:hypothetical protein [Labrenzia sp. PHM005]|uniref:hypothetical protein n=1 Tax=Labrenzia sp. PHM005 TaxID=2590016 RepID=UPI00114003D2|nr:hypothetical protein [Labrenzia sp. PHM005]QDG76972.1 hypothetical protein FJ695_14400 [Labrenzia sp. PHM005]
MTIQTILAVFFRVSLLTFVLLRPSWADERLPDGGITRLDLENKSYSAWYGSPTTRYRHGILGDAVEAASLHLKTNDQTYSVFLPEDQVFEDRTPRLSDLDNDGQPEVITIRSYLNAGGSVAVYGIRDGVLTGLASSRAIGKTNRWLNIAGIGDFAGTGQSQIAFVETPHIGGTLYFAEWHGTKLRLKASLGGFSNHKIGAREQNLSATIHYNSDDLPDLIVPSNTRRILRIVGFDEGVLKEFGRKILPSPIARHVVDNKQLRKNCAVFELENRELVTICGHAGSAQ